MRGRLTSQSRRIPRGPAEAPTNLQHQMSQRMEIGTRKIVVIDDQIGREGSPHRHWFLRQAERPAGDFIFMTGQDSDERNRPECVVRKMGDLWLDGHIALVLLDIRFDDLDDPQGERLGFRLLEGLRDNYAEMPIVMLTAETTTRAEANRGRADGFLPKTELDAAALDQRLFTHGLVPAASGGLLGTSTRFLATLREIRRAVDSDSLELLLLGETGTGKTEIAQYAHEMSPHRNGQLKLWSATRGNADMQYDQLFGHWKGAYTGANQNRAGAAELAHEGTLFIDEIAEMTADGQVALLEYRERGRDGLRRVRRLGLYPEGTAPRLLDLGNRDYSPAEDRVLVDAFLITATNRPIQDEVWRERHGFRLDLYNRLGQRIEVPPLRSRPEDIEPLFQRFLALEREVEVTFEARELLASHTWSDGNLAELRRVADSVRSLLGSEFNEVNPHHLDGLLVGPSTTPVSVRHAPGRDAAAPNLGGLVAEPATTPVAGRRAPERGVAASTWVDVELNCQRELAERLRSAVVETQTPRGTGSVPDILHHATGSRYRPSDAKREIKEILSVWFKPNHRRLVRWKGHDCYRRHQQWVRADAVLETLYRYANDGVDWDNARQEIDQALSTSASAATLNGAPDAGQRPAGGDTGGNADVGREARR